MTTTFIAAFVCYALSALLSIAFGSLYLIRTKFMPYHQEALGKSWDELDLSLQALLIGLMRTAGGGLLAAGTSLAVLLLIPFLSGDIWALYAVPGIGLLTAIPALYATILIRSRTKAHTPVVAGIVAVILLMAGFLLTLI